MSTVNNSTDRPQNGSLTRGTIDGSEMTVWVNEILNRWPTVGLALGVIRDGRLTFFHGQGLADIALNTPITEDTVFRIASLTKTFTAIAVMQLWEQGLVDLDAPANDYLHAYKLIPAHDSFQPATVRHLLTHTAGIPEVVYASDLLHPEWGPFGTRPAIHSVKVGEPRPSLAEYYHAGLQLVVEPGSAFAYSNHGFATLGQIIEDVSGMPLDHYMREHIFKPLGMTNTDLIRSDTVAFRLATGYMLGRNGARPVPDREWIGMGGSGIYSTTRDMARYVAALLGGGANEYGRVLIPQTMTMMFAPHYQPDPRVPGMGLAFFRGNAGEHLTVEHEGILPGFNSALALAPNDDLGLIAFTNASNGAMGWLPFELKRLLYHLLNVPDEAVRSDIPHHPEIWNELCGRYRLPEHISDLRGRVMMGSGVQVFVRNSHLMLRVLTPIPVLYRGLPLYPDDDTDPYVFRLDFSQFGMSTIRLIFARDAEGAVTNMHIDLGSQPMSLYKQIQAKNTRHWKAFALGALAVAATVEFIRRSNRRLH